MNDSPLTESPSRWRVGYSRSLASPTTGGSSALSHAELAEAYRANALFDAHREDPEFGYRYLADEAETAGKKTCRRTAWRICSAGGWTSVISRKGGLPDLECVDPCLDLAGVDE